MFLRLAGEDQSQHLASVSGLREGLWIRVGVTCSHPGDVQSIFSKCSENGWSTFFRLIGPTRSNLSTPFYGTNKYILPYFTSNVL